jgi:hypothetical protein
LALTHCAIGSSATAFSGASEHDETELPAGDKAFECLRTQDRIIPEIPAHRHERQSGCNNQWARNRGIGNRCDVGSVAAVGNQIVDELLSRSFATRGNQRSPSGVRGLRQCRHVGDGCCHVGPHQPTLAAEGNSDATGAALLALICPTRQWVRVATKWHDGQITKSLSIPSRKNILLAPSGKSPP